MTDLKEKAAEGVERINAELIYIVEMLVKDPRCLEGTPWRKMVHRLAIEHLETKKEHSQNSLMVSPGSPEVKHLRSLVGGFDAATDDNTRLIAAGEVTAYLYKASVEELKLVPTELKEKACVVALIYFSKVFH